VVSIVCLRDVPHHLPALARAHVQAFGTLLPEWSVQQAAAELAVHGGGGFPVTWLMLQHSVGTVSVGDGPQRALPGSSQYGGDWLGSVSLLQEDHVDMRHFSPWLASLYVRPHARGQGVATALVAHCIAQAASMKVPRLYLYCRQELLDFYRKLGWCVHQRLPLGPLQVTVMAIDTGA
jgi:GNAT superfamily N-acetyltransferase